MSQHILQQLNMLNPFSFQVLDSNWEWRQPTLWERIGFYLLFPVLLPMGAVALVSGILDERRWRRARERASR